MRDVEKWHGLENVSKGGSYWEKSDGGWGTRVILPRDRTPKSSSNMAARASEGPAETRLEESDSTSSVRATM